MAKKFYIYVRRVIDRRAVKTIPVQNANMTSGLLDRLSNGLRLQLDPDCFYVDDEEAQHEALRRATKKGKS